MIFVTITSCVTLTRRVLQGIEDDKEVQKDIDFMLESLSLEDKRYTVSHKLSGGQKRKLRFFRSSFPVFPPSK